jgi:hypothetical protein
MANGLFVIVGGCFRAGVGRPDPYEEQKLACMTHIDLFQHIQHKFHMNIDVILHTYTTAYDKDIISWYDKYLIASHFYPKLIGYDGLYMGTLEKIIGILPEYDFVHYLRVDLYLKPFFKQLFTVNDAHIKYSSICFCKDNWHVTHRNLPRVADLMVYIPKIRFHLLHDKRNILNHHAIHEIVDSCVPLSDVMFYVMTYHDSDSGKDWNPLYRIVNRPECKHWHSRGKQYDPSKNQPIASTITYHIE